VGAAAAYCYHNSLDGRFVFDDKGALLKNKDVAAENPWSDLWKHDFWGTDILSDSSHKSFRPLTVMTYRANFEAAGGKFRARGFHVVNVALHALVSALLVPVAEPVLAFHAGGATAAALLFAVHPVHTDAVASIVGRAELLSAAFLLLALLCYQRALHNGAGGGRGAVLSAALPAVLLAAAAMLCKEQGIMALPLCAAYDLIFVAGLELQPRKWLIFGSASGSGNGGGGGGGRSPVVERLLPDLRGSLVERRALLLRVLLLAAASVGAVLARLAMGKPDVFQAIDNPAAHHPSFGVRAGTYQYYYACYANMLLNPVYAALSADWSGGSVPLLLEARDPRHAASAATWLGLLALVHRATLRQQTPLATRRALAFSLAVLIVPFVPSSNMLLTVGFTLAERVLYVPSAGVCLLLGTLVMGWGQGWSGGNGGVLGRMRAGFRRPVMLWLLLLPALVPVALRTLERNEDWHSDETLFRSAMEVAPGNVRMTSALAKQLERKAPKEAERLYRRALTLDPTNSKVNTNWGRLLSTKPERFAEAESCLRTAVAHSHRVQKEQASMNLGALLAQKERFAEAEDILVAQRALTPASPRVLSVLAVVYMSTRRLPQAEETFRASLKAWPGFPDARYNLAMVLEQRHKYKQALAEYKEFQKRMKARGQRPHAAAAKKIKDLSDFLGL
jgi:protein O-mannosyl-transferase